ncbi:TetR/AcrR family transcriptional regulator [Allokutzneria albata]|uniref:DNA-binding transcriptional regulator, AcrR family n=1 Tax=Allokutzneria albata TaxID=211114 RepID=A0A1G9UYA4_ALLAB|nr:TetR/AcrR family transcriptional regulator [Allokutzneria albata]SDM64797.1 DNA-binding transcriptional regulator, AcrR family [Allokutzneria albata]
MNGPGERPLRADALRNAERLVLAAREAFAEDGPEVSLEEIARRAGVGVATLYRRFPSKDDLVRGVLLWRYEERVAPVLETALVEEDPWRGVVSSLEAALGMACEEQCTFLAAKNMSNLAAGIQERYFADFTKIVARGQAAGVVRDDLTPEDLPPITYMLLGALRFVRTSEWDWRRYLGLLLDGLRPEGATPLPEPRR